MSIIQGICSSFKLEKYLGIHNLASDTLMAALYSSSAAIDPNSITAYTTTNEISGTGYTMGGKHVLPSVGYPQLNTVGGAGVAIGQVAIMDFQDVSWSASVFTVRGALLYNASKANRAILTLDFGANISVNGLFTIQWPSPDIFNAIMRSA